MGSKAPAAPPPPINIPEPPNELDPEVKARRMRHRKEAGLRQGLFGTIFTSPMGLSAPSGAKAPVLIGG